MKRLYDFYTSSAQILKDSTDEASFVRKSMAGVSCASCDKEVSNLYSLSMQQQEFTNWNKFAPRDALPGKVLMSALMVKPVGCGLREDTRQDGWSRLKIERLVQVHLPGRDLAL